MYFGGYRCYVCGRPVNEYDVYFSEYNEEPLCGRDECFEKDEEWYGGEE